ncbi:MerR family transcriptional regulator [Saxibacter everestensis]|uniref:MerR family transcriptional regulator n=1 Tax=Saxibacter everestensis TaxID=2909229 RepID=A0ABY8QVQ0_9MICO|nr:MerR family transcriptional regulator [Brevibacteriaceae bacterium ZFBP1038]
MASASLEDAQLLRVGDLAARTGTSPRMLRYYENKGLIEAERSSSGQRLFDPAAADQVHHIRMLLAAGLPTRAISELLGCIHDPGRLEPCAVPLLVDHLRAYDSQIAELVSTRETLQGLIVSSTPGSKLSRDFASQ